MRDLEGNLASFEPISVLQLLNLAQATGELELKVRGNKARIYFDQGNVTFAEISNRPFKLGEYLVGQDLVDDDKLEELLKNKPRRKRLGALLIESGLIKEDELRRAVEEQIKESIYQIVRWHKGRFVFSRDKKPKAQDILIDIPLDHLMLEGLKRLDEEREGTK